MASAAVQARMRMVRSSRCNPFRVLKRVPWRFMVLPVLALCYVVSLHAISEDGAYRECALTLRAKWIL